MLQILGLSLSTLPKAEDTKPSGYGLEYRLKQWEKSERISSYITLFLFVLELLFIFHVLPEEGRSPHYLQLMVKVLDYVAKLLLVITFAVLIMSKLARRTVEELKKEHEERERIREKQIKQELADREVQMQRRVDLYLDAAISAIGCVKPLLSLTNAVDFTAGITPGGPIDNVHLRREVERARIVLPAIQSNFKAWDKLISARKNDDALLPVWDRCLETYFLEEAFDVHRGELVTNARNLPALLIAITEALLGTVRKRREGGDQCVLHYYAFTPVEPKDWLNWPHGEAKAYYENWFIALYYRAMAQMLKSPLAKDVLSHGRYVLCCEGGKDGFNGPFRGWHLAEKTRIQKRLSHWCVFPVALRKDSIVDIATACRDYFEQSFEGANLPVPHPHLVVPVYEKNGDSTIHFPKMRSDQQKLEKKWKDWCRVANARSFNMFSELRDVALKDGDPDVATELVRTSIGDMVENVALAKPHWETLNVAMESKDVCLFLRAMHELDAKLAAHGQYDAPESGSLTTRLLSLWLRTLSIERVPEAGLKWQSLGEWFSKELHSSSEMARLLELNEDRYKWWTEQSPALDEEFAIWGIGPAAGPVDWKLMLSASIAHPFETTRLRLADDLMSSQSGQDSMLKKAEKIVSAVTGLVSNDENVRNWVAGNEQTRLNFAHCVTQFLEQQENEVEGVTSVR